MSARDAATRATVAKFFEDRLKEARKILNAEVMEQLDPGDRKGAVLAEGDDIGTVSVTKGRKSLRVSDEVAFREWVREHSPHNVFTPEPVEQVRPAYAKSMVEGAKVIDGMIVDPASGEVVPGITQVTGDPYVSVKISDEQLDAIFQAFADGRLEALMTEVVGTSTLALEGGA